MDVFLFYMMQNIQIFLNICNLEESRWYVTEKQAGILSQFSFEMGVISKQNTQG